MIFKVLIFAFFLFFTSPIYGHSDNMHIIMRPNSFEPKELTIKQNETVEFINEDKVSRWPASNIHPTHGIYPEFDPKGEVKPGERWEFKFDKAGTFRFHDHIYPALAGQITVAGTGKEEKEPINFLSSFLKSIRYSVQNLYFKIFPSKLNQMLQSFDAYNSSYNQDELEEWLNLIGPEKYMAKLVIDTEGGSKIDCHQESHLIGRTSYKIFGRKVFQNMDYNCHSGYLHGALEAFMSTLGGRSLTEEVEKLCNSFPTSFSKFECLHGIGHGLTAYADYNLPGALALCKTLASENSQTSCFGGVFMENIMVAEGRGAVKGHQTKWATEDPHFPCNGIDKDYDIQYHCYQMQTSRMLQLRPKDYNFLRMECLKAPENMVEICFRSMGRDIAGQTLRDPQKILELCKIIPQKYFEACIKGALNVIIDFWGENIADQPQKLCEILDKNDKSSCFGLLGDRLKGIFEKDREKINEICGQGEKEYLNFCLNGSTQT